MARRAIALAAVTPVGSRIVKVDPWPSSLTTQRETKVYPTFPGELDARRRRKNVATSGGMEVK